MKKHLFITVFSIILFVVGGGLIFLLMQNRGSYNDIKSKLDDAEDRYVALSGSNPYPSTGNISVISSNLVEVEQFYADLQEKLCSGEEAPQREIERAQFAGLLETTVDDLVLNATNHNVMLPPGFYFGFDSYRGQLPEKSQVSRLVRQLEVIRICSRLLFENRITSLDLVQREVFEEEMGNMMMMGMSGMMPGTMPRGRGGMRIGRRERPARTTTKDKDGEKMETKRTSSRKKAFAIEQVTVSFTARDEQVWRVIDAISQNSRFAIIKSVTMQNLARAGDGMGIRQSSYTSPGGGMGRDPFMGDLMMGGPMVGGPMMGGPMAGGPMAGGRNYGYGFMTPPGSSGTGRSPALGRRQSTTEDGKTPLRKIPRKERTAAGQDELVKVEMELDVYQFCLDGSPPVKQEAGSS